MLESRDIIRHIDPTDIAKRISINRTLKIYFILSTHGASYKIENSLELLECVYVHVCVCVYVGMCKKRKEERREPTFYIKSTIN